MQTHHIHALLPPKFDNRDIPSQLIDFVFDIREDMIRSKIREDLFDEAFGDRQPTIVRDDVKGDIELVKSCLRPV